MIATVLIYGNKIEKSDDNILESEAFHGGVRYTRGNCNGDALNL